MLGMLRPYRILTMIQRPMMQLIDLLPCMMGSLMGCVVSKKCVTINVRPGYQELLDDTFLENFRYPKKGQMGGDVMLFRSFWTTLHLDCRK